MTLKAKLEHLAQELQCDLISLSEGDQVKRTEEFLEKLGEFVENGEDLEIEDLYKNFDWYPNS